MTDFFDHVITIPPMGEDTMTRMAREITDDPTMVRNIVHAADGNIGAMTVIQEMAKATDDWPLYLGMCLGFNIRGSMLWLLYKDICKKDIQEMIVTIKTDQRAPTLLMELPYSGFKDETK